MMSKMRPFLTLAVAAVVLMPASAEAQYYGAVPQGAPLYPYAVQPGQPYAIEVAPGTYEIRRAQGARHYPYAGEERRAPRAAPARRSERSAMRNDPAVIEELRQRHAGKHGAKRNADKVETEVINTKKVVRGKPIVIETTRVVDDPPKVIVRKRYVDDTTTASIPRGKQTKAATETPQKAEGSKRDDNKKRVIEADAEVTIIGPDRMSIRLFRKRGAQAKASAED